MRETVTAAATVTETATVRVTYGQDWTNYNRAQCAEGDLFPTMLRDLCDTVPQPPQTTGRPKMPRSDMIFTAISREYADLSARRYDSKVRAAKAEGMTECDPHFNSVLRHLRDPEWTPILQRLVKISALPLASVETEFAQDTTGFTTCQHERWYDHKWGRERSRNKWVKLHAMTGVRTNIITAVEMTDGHAHDSRFIAPTIAATAGELHDAEDHRRQGVLESRAILSTIEKVGTTPFIPFPGGYPSLQGEMFPEVAPEGSIFYKMKHMFIWQDATCSWRTTTFAPMSSRPSRP